MPTSNNPRFTRYLVDNNFLDSNPLIVVDVGARGGTESHWAHYGNMAHFIGFEPDSEECKRLNSLSGPNSNSKFYPIALYKNKGIYTFYYHKNPVASSFYPADLKIVSRFPDEVNFKIRETSLVNTMDFDSFAKENGIPDVDFIKIDAEKAELDILKGSINQLKKSVLGISCEVYFSPWRGEGKGFSEIEQFLTSLGFRLYDLKLYRFANKTFPSLGSLTPKKVCGMAHYGQIVAGEAVFFRDPVSEIENQKLLQADWDKVRILKAASLFEVFYLPDCAIELLLTASRHGLISNSEKTNIEKFCDLITSGFLGRNITYNNHLKELENIKNRGYLKKIHFYRPYVRKIPFWKKIRSLIKRGASNRNNYVF